MATDVAVTRQAWEEGYQRARTLLAGLDPATLDRPTDNPGWTVRNLATHIAIASDDFIKMCAKPLSSGRNLTPIPLPAALGTIIGNWTNARGVKKYRTAQPAELVAALDEHHRAAVTALDAIPRTAGIDREPYRASVGKP